MARAKTVKAITLSSNVYPELIELANEAARAEERSVHDLANRILTAEFQNIINAHRQSITNKKSAS